MFPLKRIIAENKVPGKFALYVPAHAELRTDFTATSVLFISGLYEYFTTNGRITRGGLLYSVARNLSTVRFSVCLFEKKIPIWGRIAGFS
jgi:hypothetical protein